MATDYKKLIDINGLTVFKQENDKLYETKTNVSVLANRVTTLENDESDANIIDIVKVNNVVLTPDATKAVNVVVPTTVAELTDSSNYVLASSLGTAAGKDFESTVGNDADLPTGAAVQAYVTGLGYQTAAQVATAVEAYGYQTAAQVATAIGNANHIHASFVTSLPDTGQTNILYLIPDDQGKDNKDMYIWDATESEFVLIGNTEVDLTGYTVESQFSVATTAQVQALFT